jgi:hypothetical protein
VKHACLHTSCHGMISDMHTVLLSLNLSLQACRICGVPEVTNVRRPWYFFMGLVHICTVNDDNINNNRKNSNFWVIAFLSRLYQIWSGFATVIFSQRKVVSLVSNPHPGGLSPCIYVCQWRVVQLYPQALGSLFVAVYDLQGCDEGILTHLHTGK